MRHRLHQALLWGRHPAAGWLVSVIVVAATLMWLAGGPAAATAVSATPAHPSVDAPVRLAGPASLSAGHLTVTLRWGHPAGRVTTALPLQWDGYLALDCGTIERVESLQLEPEQGDHVGPVVRGESDDQRFYWKSRTEADWDGVKTRIAACRDESGAPIGTLRVVTPVRTYVARLDWSQDDFVSLRAADDGSSLDVHIAADKPTQDLRRERLTQVPAAEPGAPLAELPPELAPAH